MIAAPFRFIPLLLACGAAPDEYSAPRRVGLISDDRLPEVSGIVPVTGRDGLYWVHNDSGDNARILAMKEDGTIVAEVAVKGAAATDWEDIAIGPFPAGPLPPGPLPPGLTASTPPPASTQPIAEAIKAPRLFLFLADTGNNDASRKELVVWRIPEPEIASVPTAKQPILKLESQPAVAIRFRYPGRTHDCEAMVVHPETGKIYLLTKAVFQSKVFRIDGAVAAGEDGVVQTAEEVAEMSPGFMVTAADVSRDGRRLILRTYLQVQEYRLPDGAAFEEIFLQPKTVLPSSLLEIQGEAICFAHDGRSIVTVSEAKPKVIHKITPKKTGPKGK